jgi:hypothetical protein
MEIIVKPKRQYNSLKHGLLSRAIIPGEKIRSFRKIAAELKADLLPANQIEALLVEKITIDVWRLRRALKIENDLMEHAIKSAFAFQSNANFGELFNSHVNDDKFKNFGRYFSSIERSIYRSLRELQNLRQRKNNSKTIEIKD